MQPFDFNLISHLIVQTCLEPKTRQENFFNFQKLYWYKYKFMSLSVDIYHKTWEYPA